VTVSHVQFRKWRSSTRCSRHGKRCSTQSSSLRSPTSSSSRASQGVSSTSPAGTPTTESSSTSIPHAHFHVIFSPPLTPTPTPNPYMECPTFSPQKKPMKDDVMGEPLIQRSDDNVEALTKCLGIFHMQTIPVVSCYHTITLRSIFFVMGSLDSAPDVSLCLRLFSCALEGFGMLSVFSSVSSCVLVQFPSHHTAFHKLCIIHANHVHTTTNPIEKDAL